MDSTFIDRLRSLLPSLMQEAVSLRHDFHRHPEISGEEERTAGIVSRVLTDAGIPHETGYGDTHGVIAMIESGNGADGPVIALRGDMDALPITEENDVEYRSQNPGLMHACGHDGHTANLLGVALALHALRDMLPPGRVKLIFQPAEETVRGADALVDAGVVDDVDGIIMLHGWPDMKVGQIGVRNGPVMASSDNFGLTITGKGGHGGFPHDTKDPLICGVQMVSALQTLVSREISPVSPAVVSVTMFHAGTARNIIADTAEVSGTVRTLDPALRDTMEERIRRVSSGIASAMGCQVELDYSYGTPVTVNDSSMSDLIRSVGYDILGRENVVEMEEPTMGAEDFAYYAEKVPGAMFRLGTECPYMLHTPKYNFGDAPMEPGILMMATLAYRFLREHQTP